MKRIFQCLVAFLDAIVGVQEDKSNKFYMSSYDTHEQYNAGLIPIREYSETFERKNMFKKRS